VFGGWDKGGMEWERGEKGRERGEKGREMVKVKVDMGVGWSVGWDE
jgi:hypothetical protein